MKTQEAIEREALIDHVMKYGRPISCCVVTEYRGVRVEIGNWVCDGKVYFVVKAGGTVSECMEMSAKDDVVEVVRCERCKYGKSYDDGVSFVCNKDAWATAAHGDHFCSYGKRKDGADDA